MPAASIQMFGFTASRSTSSSQRTSALPIMTHPGDCDRSVGQEADGSPPPCSSPASSDGGGDQERPPPCGDSCSDVSGSCAACGSGAGAGAAGAGAGIDGAGVGTVGRGVAAPTEK